MKTLKLPILTLAQPGNTLPQQAVGSTTAAKDLLFFTKTQRTKRLSVSEEQSSRGRQTQQEGDSWPSALEMYCH